jgi:hypothetical protein
LQQNATENASAHADLSPQQDRALVALLGGATITDAADAAGVDRTTVHRWLREDFSFQAAYNGLRRDLRREIQRRLDSVTRAALETISTAIGNGDVRAALAVLKGTGVLAGQEPLIGPEGPTEVEEEAKLEVRERMSNRLLRNAVII